MKQKLIKVIVIFFGVMAAFTILSRAAYNISTPKVMLGKAEEMELGPDISRSGVVEAREIVPVSTEEQKIIKKVHVLAGQAVKIGDTLYELNLEKLGKEIEEKENELKGIELQIESAKSVQAVTKQSKQAAQSQAVADYERAAQIADREIAAAEADWTTAENEYRKFQNDPSLYPEKTEQELLQSLQEAKKSYEAAIAAKDESLYQAQKAIDSANLPEAKDTTVEQTELMKKNIEKQLSVLKELQTMEGKVTSPINGVVSAVNIQTGGMTTGTADVMIADASADMILKIPFPAEYKEYITNGTEVELVSDALMEKEIQAVGELEIMAVQENVENGNEIEASILIPKNTLSIGTAIEVKINTKKENYAQCVPLEALHQGEDEQYYVYAIDEKKTILGTESVAQRVNVNVKYKGERYVAVEGLGVEQKFIISSTKQIQEGGRVKPQKQ